MTISRRVTVVALAFACGCGDSRNGKTSSDGGLGYDGRATTADGAVRVGPDGALLGEDGSVEGLAPGCDAGAASSRCLAPTGVSTLSRSLAVDDANLYWSASAVDGTLGYIARVPVDGGASITLAQRATASMASDGSDLYWVDDYRTSSELVIARVPVGGGTIETLATAEPSSCMTLDDSTVYWTANDGVLSVPKAGGATSTLAPNVFAFGLVDDSTNVYWVDSLSTVDMSIMSVPKTGGDVRTLFTASQGTLPYGCRALAVVGSTLYFPYQDHIASIPITGAASPTLLVDAGAPYALVADAAHLFWLGIGSQIEVDRAPLQGGTVTTLATPLAHAVSDLALTPGGTLYWATDTQIQSLAP